MIELNDYLKKLKEALGARQDWLERSDMPKLKEDFRAFHTALAVIYNFFVKKGYIADDPYRNDAKTGDLKVPEAGVVNEANKRDQIGQWMSSLIKEIDFLTNFYQFSVENFSQGKIKIMMGLIKYINWTRLSSDTDTPVTQAVSGIITTARRSGSDPVALTMLGDAVSKLEITTESIANHLKLISDFNREQYKYDLRINVTSAIPQNELQIATIKKRFASVCPKEPFYPELAEELIREDISEKGAALREAVLKKLAASGEKQKVAKQEVDYKAIVIDALNAIGGAAVTLIEISIKLSANYELMNNKKNGVWDKLCKLIQQMTNHEADPVFYDISYQDPNKGTTVRERLNYSTFSAVIEKKSKILNALAARGSAAAKLEAMDESQLVDILQRNTKDMLAIHKTLSALDSFFKTNVGHADRGKVRGIKPELGALKNAISRANQKMQEYQSLKEEAEQFKKLGIAKVD
ncbi:MAG: hypothetical protein LBV68_07910 [Spirochaetaceae bacterium]|nr:hypothetical protein [Spirochaetaceae bacterium]